EPVWQTRPNAWYIERTELIHPLSLFPAHSNIAAEEGIRYDPQTGDIVITQYPPEVAAAPVTWSANELLYWPLFPELKEEVYGNSLLAGARRPWYAKVKLENYWNTYGEKQAMSTPVFRAPLDLLDDPENPGDQITWVEYLTRFYERLLPGQAMAIGLDTDASFDVTELGVKGTSDFAPLVDYWTDQLYAAMITPRLLFDEPKHASRGQTESVAETFYMLMDAIRRELGRVLIEQVVRPLIVYNLGEQEHYGEWRWAPMQVPDLDGLSAILERVERARATGAMAGYPLTEADERHLRETFGDLYVGYDEAYPGGQVNPFEFADAGGGSVARPNPPRRYLG
nr:hypothetical protein [Candidatus Thermoplasmatota archaeon]